MFQVCWARLIGAFDGHNYNTRGSHFPRNFRARMRWESRHVKTILMSSLPPLPDISNGDNVRLTFVESIFLCLMAGASRTFEKGEIR
jgi:hypothetical protein